MRDDSIYFFVCFVSGQAALHNARSRNGNVMYLVSCRFNRKKNFAIVLSIVIEFYVLIPFWCSLINVHGDDFYYKLVAKQTKNKTVSKNDKYSVLKKSVKLYVASYVITTKGYFISMSF